MRATNGNDGQDNRVETATRKWIRSPDLVALALSDVQILEAARGIAPLSLMIASEVRRKLMGAGQGERRAVAAASPAKEPEGEERRLINAVAIEANKDGLR